jgi:hypothetical protein
MPYTFFNYVADGKVWLANVEMPGEEENIEQYVIATSNHEAIYNANALYPTATNVTVGSTPVTPQQYREQIKQELG